jgi:hypothetical protein
MPDLHTADEAMSDRYYGVPIGQLGIDGDEGVIAITHNRRRALAALSAYARTHGYSPEKNAVSVGEPSWWLLHGNCGCGETCPHKPDSDGDTVHEDPDCERYGLPPCTDGEFGWIGETCAEGTPGAVPVLLIEVEW